MSANQSGFDYGMAQVMAEAVMFAYNYYNGLVPYQFGQFKMGPKIELFEGASLGYVFFGFSAYGSFDNNPPFYNLVALRGTQTTEEAFFDVADWTMTPCILPSNGGQNCGNCATFLYDFYTGDDGGLVTSLADSFKNAVSQLNGGNSDWYLAAHSLGGAMANLGALDAVICNAINNTSTRPKMYTFGSLHVGDQGFVTAYQNEGITENYRVANLADFVPSLVGISADTPGYVHTGEPCTFLWQTDGDWGNHSMLNIYQETVNYYPQVIQFGQRTYPQ